MSFKIVEGDITKMEVDAIVNAANQSLLGGGGVDGAIHRAAGAELLEECKTLGGCRTGEAKLTKGYKLKAKYVIHTVGPIYYEHSPEDAKKLLESCYKSALEIAMLNECQSVAFPLISAGVYGYPKEEAIKVAKNVIEQYGTNVDCSLVLFDKEAIKIANAIF